MDNLFTIEKTPVQPVYMENFEHQLYIKREDLIGFSFGGNKVRLAMEFFKDMKAQGCDCMVSYGSVKSNLSRVIANLCKSRHTPCFIVTSLEEGEDAGRMEQQRTYNSSLVKQFGVSIRYCYKNQTSHTIGSLLKELEGKGRKPYYIYGNSLGRGNERTASKAYEQAYKEILEYEREKGILFDYIFLASGTGMTQGGLITGQDFYGGNGKIVGISVARNKINGVEGVKRYRNSGKEKAVNEICFLDEYLAGGYGLCNEGILDVTRRMMGDYGIPMDTTYVGKAFYGMLEYMKLAGKKGQNVLFLHTGGTPLYFDELNSKVHGMNKGS